VGCHDFIIYDWGGNGICCLSDNRDDGDFDDGFFDYYGVEEIDDFDGYFKGSIYGRKEILNGGDFASQAIERFCGEDVCSVLSPTSSSAPSTSPSALPSFIPTSSSAPTIFPDCSCGVGEFKFELELKTDWYPDETSWEISDDTGEIRVSVDEGGYDGEHLTTFNYEYCLPVGCYDFVIDDSYNDGICCGWGGDGYYKGSFYGRKEVFNGGEFGSQAIEHFCGEDLCPFATHYPSTSPSAFRPSTSPSASFRPSISSRPSFSPSLNPSTNPTISSNPTRRNLLISPILNTPFYVYTTSQPWNECKSIADNMGYSFASIQNPQENDAVADYLQSNSIWNVWLGGYQTSYEDEPTGNWAWLDGTPWTDSSYNKWFPGQPNNNQNRENYLFLWSGDGTWYDGFKDLEYPCLFRDPE